MQWEIVDTGEASAEQNMQTDAKLLEELGSNPILHFYEWKSPSATHGYFLKPEEFISLESAHKKGLDLGRRPTGGGIVFHIWDLAFSVLVPAEAPFFSLNTLDNYKYVHQIVLEVVKNFLSLSCELIPQNAPQLDSSCGKFCMARPTKYDLIYQGKKIAGAAQRKMRHGYLHQGTIALCMPDKEFLQHILLPDSRVYEAMEAYTYPLLGKNASPNDIKQAKQELRQFLITSFKGSL